jgi:hypothetical protein
MLNNLLYLNRTLYDIMSENIVEPDRPQTTIGRLRIACWVPKATIAQLLHVHFNDGYKKTPKYYVLRTLPVFFPITSPIRHFPLSFHLRPSLLKLLKDAKNV